MPLLLLGSRPKMDSETFSFIINSNSAQNNVSCNNNGDATFTASGSNQPDLPNVARGGADSTVSTSTSRGLDSFTSSAKNAEKSVYVLCVLHKRGKIGAAYYNISTCELFLVQEMFSDGPEFPLVENLYHELKPGTLLTIGKCSSFADFLIRIVSAASDDTVTDVIPSSVQLLSAKEYNDDTCRASALNLRLVEQDDADDKYISSLVDVSQEVSLYALGALKMYLSKHWREIKIDVSIPAAHYVSLNVISYKNIVLVEYKALRALQVFQEVQNPAGYRFGADESSEGNSLYKLLNRCSSMNGAMRLRNLLMQPTYDIQELRMRLQVIDFAVKPKNLVYVKSLKQSIADIACIHKVLSKLMYYTAPLHEWTLLHRSLQSVLIIQDLCANFPEVTFFIKLIDNIDDSLLVIVNTINKTIDFENTASNVTVKEGVDHVLDAKKSYRKDLGVKITEAALLELPRLPEFINSCRIAYIPEIGYLVCIEKWSEDCNHAELENENFRHMFTFGNVFHYKSRICVELDKSLGDIYRDIIEHEARIIKRLRNEITSRSALIQKSLKLIGLLECLLCMAEVSRELGFVRPQLTEESIMEIDQGRHPLLELYTHSYVPNSFCSGARHSHIKILTGPNNSGKSVYMKQTALIVYMAHLGMYVPASSAVIGTVRSIHCQLNIGEGPAVGISSFMQDLHQAAGFLRQSKSSSMIISDEFGKGTGGADGLVVLATVLESLLLREEYCPHVLVSTHFHEIVQHVPPSKLVEYKHLDYMRDDKGNLVFLHKLVEGAAGQSCAFDVAITAGLPMNIIKRAKEVMAAMKNNVPVQRVIEDNTTSSYSKKKSK